MKKFLSFASFCLIAVTALVFTACSDDDDTKTPKKEPAALTANIVSIAEADTLNGATFTFNVANANPNATYFLAIGADKSMKAYTLAKATQVGGSYQATVYMLDRSIYYSYKVVEMYNQETTAQSAKLGEFRLGTSYDMSQISASSVEVSDIALTSARITIKQPQNATGVKFYVYYADNEELANSKTLELARNDAGDYYVDVTGLSQGTTYYYQLASLKDHIYETKSDASFLFTTQNDPTFVVTVDINYAGLNEFGIETLKTIANKLRSEYASADNDYRIVEPAGFDAAVATFNSVTDAKRAQYAAYLKEILSSSKYLNGQGTPNAYFVVGLTNAYAVGQYTTATITAE